jgi:NAD(P)-dependent dehydrogenase (short-subunit alcohol dehydrogenase family)
MAERFKNKAIIVTGAGNGMGRASARAFAREGGSVAVANGTGIDHRQLDAPVMAVAAHPNGRHITAALADGSVALLTMGTHQELRIAGVWPLGGDALRGCAWLPDGRLVCGDKDGQVSCWDVTA